MTAVMVCMALSAVFEAESVPLAPNARVFLGQGDRPGRACVFVLSGNALHAYPEPGGEGTVVALPRGAFAFDVADVDGDGQAELVVIHGESVLRYDLFGPHAGDRPAELFRLATQLSTPAAQPSPHVIVIEHEGEIVLALPREESLELRDPAGRLVAAFPIGEDAPRRVTYGPPFSAVSISPPEVGPGDALEMRVSRLLDYEPELPESILPPVDEADVYRRGAPGLLEGTSDRQSDYWPWFPLTTDGATGRRVLYASGGPGGRDTIVRIREAHAGPNGEVRVHVKRRYPGTALVLSDTLPDFNGDGYVDLVLWRAPQPGVSVNSLARVLTEGSWPVHVSVHLFDPEQNVFAARPQGRLSCRVPVACFWSPSRGVPLRHPVAKDLDGDGRSDLGFCTAPAVFAVWLWRDPGFADTPDFVLELPEPIEAIPFCRDLGGDGRPTLALRTGHVLHLLRPSR